MKEYKFNSETSLEYKWNKKKIQKMVRELNEDRVVEVGKETFLTSKISFDIETTSLYHTIKTGKKGHEKEKVVPDMGFMYIWMVGLNGQCVHGRTWEEFLELINMMKSELNLSKKKKVVIMIHNLEFEFQFMRKFFHFDNVFFSKRRKVLYCETEGIMFRDSCSYAGKKLEKVGEDLLKYKVQKQVGSLDYSLIRTKDTKLSEQEMKYCICDVIILNNYLQEEEENYSFEYVIQNLTKTSKVRYDMRMNCFFDEEDGELKANKQNSKQIHTMRLTSDDYRMLRRNYQGGFTHGNRFHVGKVFKNVHSRDFTSSYPAVMLSEKFPSASFKEIENLTSEQFQYYMSRPNDFACLFDCEISNLESLDCGDDIISISKCYNIKESEKRQLIKEKRLIDNNGRLKSCSVPVRLTLNEIDFQCLRQFYSFTDIKILKFKYAPKSYLPKWFIEGVLYYYKQKTEFKNVEGKEVEYQSSKEKVNSLYGMLVEDLIHCLEELYDLQSNTYKETSQVNSQNISDEELDKIISKYNKNRKRFTFFAWGVWVTSYARRNLFSGILELGNDYLYSDTDSVKYLNDENHREYFDRYNQQITEKIGKCLDFYHIDRKEAAPLDKDGISHQLGVWDWETKGDKIYHKFKTLGAKRYIYTQKNKKTGKIELHITIAGLGKEKGAEYLSQFGDAAFDKFKDGMTVPAEYTGKLTHFYIDEEKTMEVTDYQGHTTTVTAPSGIVLAPCEFSLGMTDDFLTLLEDYTETDEIDQTVLDKEYSIK